MEFEKIISMILDHEGGFVNHPSDEGGPTNFGITIHTLQAFRQKPISIDDVKKLQKSEAIQIYKHNYWDALSLDFVKGFNKKAILMDQGVNRGVTTVIQQVQKTLNELGYKLTVDGRLGKITLKALNEADDKIFVKSFLRSCINSYVKIVNRNPRQIVFLQGWINRIYRLEDFIKV